MSNPHGQRITVGSATYVFQRDPTTGAAQCLGRGSFGAVYLVAQEDDPTALYAAKILRPTVTAGAADNSDSAPSVFRAQLEANWTRMRGLDHPNLVRYLHAEMRPDTGQGVVILEYCPLGNLEQYLARCRRNPTHPAPSPAALRGCTRDLLRGLHYLHTQRIIHTDLKPTNILLTTSEGGRIVVKLADMDDHVGILASVTRSEIRATRGTVRYMSPEMFRLAGHHPGRERVGRKTDVWSAGVVVGEMTRGERPLRFIKMDGERPVPTDYLDVDANTPPFLIMDFVLNHGVPEVVDGVLGGFAGVLRRCFRWNGAERPTAEELLRDPWLAEEHDVLLAWL
ncbi:uncharacterized protein LOC129588860 [Paramacrobiotus metropolitanus]|uniref:uncharacterized protein LOC129588860 n=1 Tax=Paramacrobiotus metropolitanus TaxID=2943436 RepID=UPI00244586A1|nr:uncharacterized protein LOC129588860 [Paramacrobiotus metropolitanus]